MKEMAQPLVRWEISVAPIFEDLVKAAAVLLVLAPQPKAAPLAPAKCKGRKA